MYITKPIIVLLSGKSFDLIQKYEFLTEIPLTFPRNKLFVKINSAQSFLEKKKDQ